jgi:hypothetical protein
LYIMMGMFATLVSRHMSDNMYETMS